MIYFKIIIFTIMIIGYCFCNDVIEPLIKNSVYMNQMTQDGLSYALLHSYPYIKGIYIILLANLFVTIIIGIIRKIKLKKGEDE